MTFTLPGQFETADSAPPPPPQDTGEPTSLWQSAYEHPVETGVAIVATAASVAALVLSRGRLARAFAPKQQEVLVVEAAPFMGKAMKTALQEQGHNVTWVTEINRLRPLTGLSSEGKDVPLNLRRFHTAFVDPNHVNKAVPEFTDLAPMFRRSNVRTIGTSVMDETNQRMLASGFDAAGSKPMVLTSIVGGNLNLRDAYRNPASAQRVLDWMKAHYDDPVVSRIKGRASELIQQSM